MDIKIIILALARTGSTSLAKAIKNQGFYTLMEPYANSLGSKYQVPPKEAKLHSKFCTKTVVTQTQGKNLKVKEKIEFNLKAISGYTKVILLDRKNMIDHAESLAHIGYLHGLGDTDLHSKYEYNIIPNKERKELYNDAYDILTVCKDILNTISYRTQNRIIYYEDIFNNDKNVVKQNLSTIFDNYIDVDKMVEDLDTKHKYRVSEKSLI